MAISPTVVINVSGARGRKGDPSGPLGLGSVTADTISNSSSEQAAIGDKLGLARVKKLVGTNDYGTAGTGVTESLPRTSTIALTAAGSSQVSDVKWTTRLAGTGSATEVRPFEVGAQYYHDGLATIAYDLMGYLRIGVDGTKAAAVTSARACEFHIANEGNGDIATAQVFQAGDVDFRGLGNTTGTGKINKLYGFRTNNLQGQGADAGRVVAESVGFQADDVSAGATLTASFRSEMSSGTGKYAFASTQGAPSAFQGKMRVGSFGTPTDQMEVMNGFLKASTLNAYIAPGGFHELTSDRADFAAYAVNTHASTPNGLAVRFINAAPNNTTQMFFRGQDSGGSKIVIWSNGNLVNSNNSYGAISDVKLKRDISDARSQIDDIRALRLRNYRLIADGDDAPEQLGLIAQEAQEVSPGLVSSSPDMESYWEQAYEPGGVGEADIPLIGQGEWKERPTGEVTLSVNYSLLYLKTFGALQEALKKIDDLDARVASMEEAK